LYVFEWGKNLMKLQQPAHAEQAGRKRHCAGLGSGQQEEDQLQGYGERSARNKECGNQWTKSAEGRMAAREDIVVDQPVSSNQEAQALPSACYENALISF
jgi:hypothetical protein